MQLFAFVRQGRPGRFAMAAGGVRTRRQSATELENFLGSRKKLSDTELPTLRAVLRHCLYLQDLKYTEEMVHKKSYLFKDIVQELIPCIVGLWRKANIAFQRPVIITEKQMKKTLVSAYKTASDISRKRITSTKDWKK